MPTPTLDPRFSDPAATARPWAETLALLRDAELYWFTTVRADGRKMHDMYLYEVKKPSESKGPWDYYKQVAVLKADDAFKPLAESECPLVKK